MAESQRVRQPFHHQYPAALGPADPVGRTGVRLAAPVGGQAAVAAELHEDGRGGVDGDAARQGQVALAETQRLNRHVQRHQRRRTRRVHRHRGPFEAEDVGDPAGGDARRHAGQAVALDDVGGHAVAAGDHPGEDAGGAAPQGGGVQAGALERLPGEFEEHALLGIHRQRLGGRHPEEAGVEVGDVVDEAAGAGVGLPVRVRVGVEQAGEVPAAVGGEVGHHVAPAGHHVPQRVGRVDAARVPARHPDHRNRFGRSLQQRAVLGLQPFDLDKRLSERLGCVFELVGHPVLSL